MPSPIPDPLDPSASLSALKADRLRAQQLYIAQLDLPALLREFESSTLAMLEVKSPFPTPGYREPLPVPYLLERLSSVNPSQVKDALLTMVPAMFERIIDSGLLSARSIDSSGGFPAFAQCASVISAVATLTVMAGEVDHTWMAKPYIVTLLTCLRALRGPCSEVARWEKLGFEVAIRLGAADIDWAIRKGMLDLPKTTTFFSTEGVVALQEHLIARASTVTRGEIFDRIAAQYGCPRTDSEYALWIASRMRVKRPAFASSRTTKSPSLSESTLTGLVLRAVQIAKTGEPTAIAPASTDGFVAADVVHPFLRTGSPALCLHPTSTFRTRCFLEGELSYQKHAARFESVSTVDLRRKAMVEIGKVRRYLDEPEFTFRRARSRSGREPDQTQLELQSTTGCSASRPGSSELAALGRYLETRDDCPKHLVASVQAIVARLAIFGEDNDVLRFASLMKENQVPALLPHELTCLHPMERAAALNRAIFIAYDAPFAFDYAAAITVARTLATNLPSHFRGHLAEECLKMLKRLYQNDSRFRGNFLQKVSHDIEGELDRPGEIGSQDYYDHIERMMVRGKALEFVLFVLSEVANPGDAAVAPLDELRKLGRIEWRDVKVKKGGFTFEQRAPADLLQDVVTKLTPTRSSITTILPDDC